MFADPVSVPFFSFDVGNVAILAGLALSFWRIRTSAIKEKDSLLRKQVEMHEENKHQLSRLTEFKEEQETLNSHRATQVDELRKQTSELEALSREFKEMARGFHRRLEMLEDRRHRDRP